MGELGRWLKRGLQMGSFGKIKFRECHELALSHEATEGMAYGEERIDGATKGIARGGM